MSKPWENEEAPKQAEVSASNEEANEEAPKQAKGKKAAAPKEDAQASLQLINMVSSGMSMKEAKARLAKAGMSETSPE